MKYEIMTFKLLQYHIVKYDTVVNKYLGGEGITGHFALA